MRTLKLSIRQKYLDAIKDGRKVQEFREVRPNNIKKFLQLDEDGFEKEDENANAIPISMSSSTTEICKASMITTNSVGYSPILTTRTQVLRMPICRQWD